MKRRLRLLLRRADRMLARQAEAERVVAAKGLTEGLRVLFAPEEWARRVPMRLGIYDAAEKWAEKVALDSAHASRATAKRRAKALKYQPRRPF